MYVIARRVQSANCGHGPCAQLLTSKAPAAAVQHVVFTGSVRGGQAIYRTTASASFADVTLELGGKDAAYVAEDADLESAVACVVRPLVDDGRWRPIAPASPHEPAPAPLYRGDGVALFHSYYVEYGA
jgi:delta 1-pyrroline-5-carboxylate dehydrogenase|eukprot:COSAG01_NODE_3056_length_6658_cov_3.019210_10_plen_128_part_00